MTFLSCWPTIYADKIVIGSGGSRMTKHFLNYEFGICCYFLKKIDECGHTLTVEFHAQCICLH